VSSNLDYKDILNRSARELSELIEQREELDDIREKLAQRINGLRDLVFALSNVLNQDPYKTHPEVFPELIEPETGFTDAVREVLTDEYQSPVDIRDELKRRRYNLEKYRNPLAAIHQILSRLESSGEVKKHEEKKLYKRQRVSDGTLLPAHGAGGGSPPPKWVETALNRLRDDEKEKIPAPLPGLGSLRRPRVRIPEDEKDKK